MITVAVRRKYAGRPAECMAARFIWSAGYPHGPGRITDYFFRPPLLFFVELLLEDDSLFTYVFFPFELM